MFFVLFAYFSQAKKQICVCKGECSSLCTESIFNASSNTSFVTFLNNKIKKEEEIEIDFYSKASEFTFSIDTSMFGTRKVTFKTLHNSYCVFLQITEKTTRKPKTVKLDANYKIDLPSLIPYREVFQKKMKSAPIPSNIPISVGLHQMIHQGEASCSNRNNDHFQLSSLPASTSSNCGCPNGDNDLDKASAYQCGYLCYGAANYSYTFKGVQFALYGTSDSNKRNVYVEVDDTVTEIIIYSENVRLDFTLLYASDVLEYKEHNVKIYPKSENDQYELHKFVYWPTLTAKRINASDFTFNADGQGDLNIWKTETDGIGGYRTYRSYGGTAIIKLHCTRFWIYGLLDTNLHNITINYNGKTDSNYTRSSRKENTLVYESPEFEHSEITLNIKPSEGTLIIYCIYYDEPPSPIQTPIPISVNIQQMEHSNVGSCSSSTQNSIDISLNTNNFGCTTDFNAASAYQCGIKCRGSGMTLSFNFKGVKFGLFGLYDPSFGIINVGLDGKNIANIDANNACFPYANYFESDVYVYKEHTVTINSTGLYEIYKLVFWPSTRANRYNSSEFSYSSGSIQESDRIGGVRHYFNPVSGSTRSYQKTFSCSKFFIYTLTDKNYDNVTITFDDKRYSVNQESSVRKDSALIFESDEFEYKSITLKGENNLYLVLYCVYYHTQPSELEYVDKTFNITLPYFQILVTQNSNVNQISGCKFVHISELFDYFITLEKDVSFHDNIFEYSNSDDEKYALPIKIHYNSAGSNFLTIRNCRFIQATRKTSNFGANVFYCSREYSINVDFQSCEFEDCGVSSSEMIIQIESQGSHIKMDNCTFQFSQNSCKALSTSCSIAEINKCSFIKTGPIIIDQTANDPSSTQSLNNIAITNCMFNSCTCDDDNCACVKLNIKTSSSITFEYNYINNIKITDPGKYAIEIDGNNQVNEINMKNITFTDNSCESLYGGGVGMVIHNTPSLIFEKCNFINNEAKQNSNKARSDNLNINEETQYFNGDGGGIQIGFYCTLNKATLKFEGCEFKRNRAQRHGGAIAIQTLNTIVINNCIFEENKANVDFSTSKKNLLENHFSKKQQGRAGAIYVNPTYQYTSNDQNCLNTDDYLKSISITNTQFLSNSAYDGYAIYVEGDQTSTSFEINNNIFDGNYNLDQTTDQNDQNLKVRGVIATEIHTISFDIIKNNEFSNLHSKELIYVDHYGIIVPTNIFSMSGYFSDSKMFTKSAVFSASEKFSATQYFTLSDKFSNSQIFSNSEKFSATQYFTLSDKFSNSQIFSNSEKFSATQHFTETQKFSNSQDFSSTEMFTQSSYFTPSVLPDDQQCALYINGEYKHINDCDYVETEGQNTFIEVITSNFTDYKKHGDGSAIHLVNCGFKCNSTYFIDCVSTSDFGSGGAIYINNSVNFEQNATFINLFFLRCKAAYGGAVFIYSSSEQSSTLFIHCRFVQNQAYLKKPATNENKNLYGGGGIFAMVKEITISNCSFYKNSGSGVKICNIFVNEKSKLLDKNENTFSIIDCDFEKDANSKSSISFVDENIGNKLNIMNCNFKGKLDDMSHYIDGTIINKDNIKLDSCSFESNENIPMNFELFSEEKHLATNRSSNNNCKIILVIGLFSIILSLFTLKIRINNNLNGSNEKILEA